MFKHLSTRLTVLYAGLFIAALAAIALAVYAASAANAERIGRDQLAATGVVFDRLLATRMEALQDEAALHGEPDAGFMPMSPATAARIEVEAIAEPLLAGIAGYAVDPQFFPFPAGG